LAPRVAMSRRSRLKRLTWSTLSLTYCAWRREYGGFSVDHAKRFKEREQENARLKRLLADSDLDTAIWQEAARGRVRC
jgi:hypothetical protein